VERLNTACDDSRSGRDHRVKLAPHSLLLLGFEEAR
jgi:hypothetical protein